MVKNYQFPLSRFFLGQMPTYFLLFTHEPWDLYHFFWQLLFFWDFWTGDTSFGTLDLAAQETETFK